MSVRKLEQHIEETPGVVGGKPRIAGRRITVQDIVVWHDRLGRSVDEVAAEYGLTLAEVHAALAFYFDHREEIDRKIDDDRTFIQELRERSPSALQRRLSRLRGDAPG